MSLQFRETGYGSSWIERLVEHNREFYEKCITERSDAMTLTELNKAVRALVPAAVSTSVELKIATYSHGNVGVSVWVSADTGGRCEGGYSHTAEEALETFRLQTLPALGLTETAPSMERLAALDVDTSAVLNDAGE